MIVLYLISNKMCTTLLENTTNKLERLKSFKLEAELIPNSRNSLS